MYKIVDNNTSNHLTDKTSGFGDINIIQSSDDILKVIMASNDCDYGD